MDYFINKRKTYLNQVFSKELKHILLETYKVPCEPKAKQNFF